MLLLDKLIFLNERKRGLTSTNKHMTWYLKTIRTLFKQRASRIRVFGFIRFLGLNPSYESAHLILDYLMVNCF